MHSEAAAKEPEACAHVLSQFGNSGATLHCYTFSRRSLTLGSWKMPWALQCQPLESDAARFHGFGCTVLSQTGGWVECLPGLVLAGIPCRCEPSGLVQGWCHI